VKALDELMSLAKWKDAFDEKLKSCTDATLSKLNLFKIISDGLPDQLKKGDPADILLALAGLRQTATDLSISIDGMIAYLSVLLGEGDLAKLRNIFSPSDPGGRTPAPEIPVMPSIEYDDEDDDEVIDLDDDAPELTEGSPGGDPEDGEEPTLTDDDLKAAGLT